MDFPLRNVLFWSFLAMLMIPAQVTLIPEFLLLAWLNWFNSYQALLLPGITSAFGTSLIRQYLQGFAARFRGSRADRRRKRGPGVLARRAADVRTSDRNA